MEVEEIHLNQMVYLNSGSPVLYVMGIDGESVAVAWVDGMVMKEAVFPASCLIPVVPYQQDPQRWP